MSKDYEYAHWKKAEDTHEERLKNVKPWTEEERKAFHDLYGKHWYIFQGVEFIPHEPTWIEQYRVKDPEYNGGGRKAGRPKKNS